MKKFLRFLLKNMLIAALFLNITHSVAQNKERKPTSDDFRVSIQNVKQTDDKTIEFDICILKTNRKLKFELASFQAGIKFNTQILGGAPQSPDMTQILAGTSELADSISPMVVNTASAGLIRLAGRPAPKKGGGTLVPDKGKGLRICRLKLTNSVPFAANLSPDFQFTANVPAQKSYATRVAVYFESKILQLDIIPDKNTVSKEPVVLNPVSGK